MFNDLFLYMYWFISFNDLVDEESEDFECASVITSHTQDVKKIVWHPNKEVIPYHSLIKR